MSSGDKSDIQDRILETSRQIFFSRGFSKVTMDELAEKLGMSKKTIYANFDSKDEIVSAVLERHMAEVLSKKDEILNSRVEFMEKLYNLCALISESISQKSPEFMSDLQRNRGDLWEKLEEHRRTGIFSTSSKLMEEGVKLGAIRADVDKEIATLVLLHSIMGIINPGTLARNSLDGPRAFEEIVRTLFEGILTDQSRGAIKKFCGSEGACKTDAL